MSLDEYWRGDTGNFKYYRKAYELKLERENERLWLQGLYVYEAICCCTPVLRAFSKARKPTPYPKEPYQIYEKQNNDKNKIADKSKSAQEKNDMKAKAMMDMFAMSLNKKFAKKNKKNGGAKNG